ETDTKNRPSLCDPLPDDLLLCYQPGKLPLIIHTHRAAHDDQVGSVEGRNFVCLVKRDLYQFSPAFPDIIGKKTAWFIVLVLKYSYTRPVYTPHILSIVPYGKKRNLFSRRKE